MIELVPYDAERHRGGVREVLARNGWDERYVAGQLDALYILSADTSPGTRGRVYVHEAEEGRVGGFVSVEFREWNRLGQLHGLAVDPHLKRRGIASALVHRAEEFVRGEGGRGLYVDTPVTNEIGRRFYECSGSFVRCPLRATYRITPCGSCRLRTLKGRMHPTWSNVSCASARRLVVRRRS